MKKAKVNDSVRLLDYPKEDINEYAKVKAVYEDGRVWVANLNMPYMGTISKIVSKNEFERMTGMTV